MACSHPVITATLVNLVISTENKEPLVNFYQTIFGFSETYSDATSSFLRMGSLNLVFVVVKDRNLVTRNACIDFAVPNLEVAKAALIDFGLVVAEDQPGILTFNDPDGNLIEIVNG